MSEKRSGLATICAFGMVLALSACHSSAPHAAVSPTSEGQSSPIAAGSATLYVNGLGCPLCATNVDKQLKRVPGVDQARVDLGEGRILLKFSSGTHPSEQQLVKAVTDAGFTFVRLETP